MFPNNLNNGFNQNLDIGRSLSANNVNQNQFNNNLGNNFANSMNNLNFNNNINHMQISAQNMMSNMNLNNNNMPNLNINNEYNNNNNNISFAQNYNPLSEYQEISVLGKGHYGSVKKVKDRNGKIFALKEIKIVQKKNEIIHLKRESSIPLMFDHKNIIKYYNSFEYNGNCYILAEFYESQNLKDFLNNWIDQSKKANLPKPNHIPQDFVINIFRQLLDGLVYLHGKNIAHRDIKPDNILINANNLIKYTDFGLAAYLEGEDKGELSGGKTQVGTRSYGPPEIVFYKSYETVDLSCDIFSLGYTMFELMNFELPTRTDKVKREKTKKNNEDRFYNPYLAKLVDQMYETENTRRPTANQCLELLNKIDMVINNNSNNNNFININKCMNFNISFNYFYYIFQDLETSYNNLMETLERNTESKRAIKIKNTRLLTSMECLLSFFCKMKHMANISNEMEMNLETVKKSKDISKLFINLFCKVYKSVFLKQNKISTEMQYKSEINNFIIEIFNRQNKTGVNPIILFYSILSIINQEYLSLDDKIKYDLQIFKNHCFISYFSFQQFWPPMFEMINEFKSKYKNPMIKSFGFILFSVLQCSQCGSIFEIVPQSDKMAYFLPLDVKSDDSISNMIINFFKPQLTNHQRLCNNCRCYRFAAEKDYMLNSPDYLVLELMERYNINFDTNIKINNLKASTEGPFDYDLFAVIIFCPDKYEYEIKMTSDEIDWSKMNCCLSFNFPSMAVYKRKD